jgi:dihydropyrimidine dehydrogenase (NAD+) subunit PreA
MTEVHQEATVIDTTVAFAGLELPSPILVGAGPNTRTVELCVAALRAGAGAVEVAGPPGVDGQVNSVRLDEFQLLPSKADAFHKRFFGFATTGARRRWPGRENSTEHKLKVIQTVKEETRGLGAVFASIGSVTYRAEDGLTWGEMAARSQEAGADAVVLHLQTGQFLAGSRLTEEPDRLPGIVREIKAFCSIPVIAKLPIEGCDPVALARIALDAGADGVAPTARYVGLSIDIDSEAVSEWGGFHGYGGPWALPITAAWTAKMRRAGLGGALIPGGGVMSWKDIVRLLLVGANMAQVCTWPILRGYGVLGPALEQLRSWMSDKGYRRLDDFRGGMAAGLKEPDDIWGRSLDRGPYQGVRVKPEDCTGCGACLHVCFFDALTLDDDKRASIDRVKCSGCGCCYHICPFDAIVAPPGPGPAR